MAPFEDMEDKTEAPTPRRREEARERGQVSRSADLSAAAALLAAMLLLNYFGPGMLIDMKGLFRESLGYSAANGVHPASMFHLGFVALYALARLLLPLLACLMGITLLVSWLQVGTLFTLHPLQPSLDKINPISGFFRIFSFDSVVKLGLNLLKVSLVGFIAYLIIKDRLAQIACFCDLDFGAIILGAGSLIYSLGLKLAIVLMVIAIFDYAYNRFQQERQIRMSKQELKEELRRMEGDPLVKERRKRVARQLAMQRMQMAVPKADVVVTNPTELAIALRYDSDKMTAPKVVAKGAGFVAARIRQIAIRSGVPIVERKPLAQALYRSVEVGQEIPPAFYKAVAEILAYVYELAGKTGMPRPGARVAPVS